MPTPEGSPVDRLRQLNLSLRAQLEQAEARVPPINDLIDQLAGTWRLRLRNGVFYADGRGGEHPLGKHSLGTKYEDEATANLQRLDGRRARERGLAEPTDTTTTDDVSVEEGWGHFLENRGRPQVLGGVSKNSLKRFRAVRDKHVEFCRKHNLRAWTQIDRKATELYGRHLAKQSFADRTIYLELTLIASVVKWLATENRLAPPCRFSLSLSKPQGSDTHCYTREQVGRMVEHCGREPKLRWLRDVIVALATTGLRIGELLSLRWQDVDFASNTIRLTDERSSSRKQKLGNVRTIKGRRGRALPLHPALRNLLEGKERHADGIVFHGRLGGRLKPSKVLKALIAKVIEPLTEEFPSPAGEIGFQHGRVHSLRHYFVSESFRQGATEAQIMEWVGHRSSEMVRLYRHLRADDSQRKMREIDFQGTGSGPVSE
jgi:integrase